MPILGIDHVVIRCRDLPRAVDFYCDGLGCAVAWRRPDLGLVHLRAGAALIDLVDIAGRLGGGGEAPDQARANLDHFCLSVAPFEPDFLIARIVAAGGAAEAPQRRYGAEGYGMSLYCRDPEGNRIEIKGPAEPGTRAVPG
jgi:catechol 2,3-dioxygenase-like lactoylglutathione lyase family enzyme